MADFPKKQQQCLIPKYLLDYTTELNKNHPDPTDPWGGGGGSPIEAGTGIIITGDETKTISLDTNPDTFEVTADTGMTLEVENSNPLWKDSKLQMSNAGAIKLEGTQISLEANNIYLNSDNAPYYVNNTTHEYKTLATTDQLFSGNYNDLYNKPTIPDAVSGTNDGTNWTSLTIGEDTYGLASGGGTTYTAGTGIDITSNVISIDNTVALKTDIPTVPTNVSAFTNDAGYITGINSSDVIAALGYTPGTSNFSGSYNDLTNKPTIPTKTSQLTNDSNYIPSSTSNDKVYSIYEITPFGGYWTRTTYGTNNIYFESNNGSTSLNFDSQGTNNVSIGIPNVGGTMALTSDIITSYNDLTDKPTIPTTTSQLTNNSGFITNTVNNLTNYTLTSNLATVATSGDYDDLINKPTIPVVPTNVSSFTNDAGYITGITSSDVTTALGYTPGTSNFSGSYTDLTDKPTIPTVNDNTITITQGGVTKGSFTLNQNTNQTINVDDVPGMIGEVLYDVPNGEAGVNPITMAHSFADYSYVDIQYRNYDNAYEVKSVRVYDPNGKHVYVDWDVLVNGTVYAKKSIYELSGNTMTVKNGTDMQVWYSNGSTMGTSPSATTDYQYQIKITKVVGYKQNSAPIVIPTTATSVSTVTPSTIQLKFTYTDNTTQTVTLMTGASVSTTTTLS